MTREPTPVDQQTDHDLRVDAALLRLAHRAFVHRLAPQIGQDTTGVKNRGRFNNPSDHQITEGLIAVRDEPEAVRTRLTHATTAE